MGEIGRAILGLDLRAAGQRRLHVAVVAQAAVLPRVGEALRQGAPVRRLLGRERRRAPFRLDRGGAPEGAPGVVGQHRHAAGDGHDAHHPAHRLGPGRVVGQPLPARARIGHDRGVQHPLRRQVDAVARGAGGRGHDVDPAHRPAQQPPLGRRAQRHVGGGLPRPGLLGQIGIGDRPAPGQQDAAGLAAQLGDGDARPRRGGGLQRLARHRAGLAQLVVGIGHRGGAARHLQPDQLHPRPGERPRRLGRQAGCRPTTRRARPRPRARCSSRPGSAGRARRAGIDRHLVELHVEFLGDQRGLDRIGPLPHVGPRGDERHAGAGDLHVGRQRRLAGAELAQQRVGVGPAHRPDAEGHAPGDGGAADEEAAAGDRSQPAHPQPRASSAAAARIAARIRG